MSWILFAGISIIGYKLLSNKINAWANVYSNELYTEVPPVLVELPPPKVNISGSYQTDVSLYAIDLIRRFSEAIYFNHDMDIPDGLTPLGLIAYQKNEPPIVIVLADKSGHAWIVVRGTHTSTDFRHDTMFHQVSMYSDQPYLKVHEGFYEIFSIIMPKIYTLLRHHGAVRSATVTGHSMGGAVATLIAFDLNKKGSAKIEINQSDHLNAPDDSTDDVRIYDYSGVIEAPDSDDEAKTNSTRDEYQEMNDNIQEDNDIPEYSKHLTANAYIYASPRAVNYEMSNNIDFPIFRIDNTEDIVATKPPPLVVSFSDIPNTYNHVGQPIYFTENRLSFEKNHTIPIYYDFVFKQYRFPP